MFYIIFVSVKTISFHYATLELGMDIVALSRLPLHASASITVDKCAVPWRSIVGPALRDWATSTPARKSRM